MNEPRRSQERASAEHHREESILPGQIVHFEIPADDPAKGREFDVNAGAARVRELGGEADEPGPVPGMGWFVTCRDTQGNDFGLWQHDTSAPTPAA